MAEWSFGTSQRKRADKNVEYPGPGSYSPSLRHQQAKPSWSMGKPPNYKLSKGAYQFSPGPSVYNVTNMPARTIYLSNVRNIYRSSSKSPEKLNATFEYARKCRKSEFRKFDSPFRPSETLTNMKFRESGPYFGSSGRKPLNIQEKLGFPGPGSYKIKEKLTQPKCKDINFGIGSRSSKFLRTGGISPGPAKYKLKPLIGKALMKRKRKTGLESPFLSTSKRTNSVFAMSGETNIITH
ncbi:unnamed protein product [Moneuplotes crassus]|uniref:Uncharacterized protein n=1 Tax=Euplotes crassus TaxID=5936 RepID=A0AAD2D3S7_EUPCR|nr:unnamed protein product [Moneuplotes crassus]